MKLMLHARKLIAASLALLFSSAASVPAAEHSNPGWQPTVETATTLATELHKGQVDHSGRPYIHHVLRVKNNLLKIHPQATQEEIIGALLHDTVEDCGVTAEYLLGKGYSAKSVSIIMDVTKPENDTREYDQVIDDLIATGNRSAMLVKIADNMDNLHPARRKALEDSNPEKAKRLATRYWASIEKLCNAAGVDFSTVHKLIEENTELDEPQPFPVAGSDLKMQEIRPI